MDWQDGMQDRRRDRIDPLGQVLRTTFDADNHASLDGPTTALMLELARLPSPDELPPSSPPPLSAPRSPAPAATLFGRMRRLIGR